MKKYNVLHLPHQGLRKRAKNVFPIEKKLLSPLIEEMVATMRRLRGIGIAATQLGIHQRIAVIEMKDGPRILINPEIEKRSKKTEDDEEGCLSVPEVFGMVRRSASLKFTAHTLEGKRYSCDAKGLFARVVQHEVDHLNGILFVDLCSRLTNGVDRARSLGLIIPS